MTVELEEREPLLIRVSGALSEENGEELLTAVRSLMDAGKTEAVVELSAVDSVDSIGGAYLARATEEAEAGGMKLGFQGARGGPEQFISLFRSSLKRALPLEKPRRGFLESIGEKLFSAVGEARSLFSLMVESIYWTFIAPFERKGLRWSAVWDEMYEMGVRAILIVYVINLLLGLIIAMLSAAQLKQFGAIIFVADLVAIAFTRELAALMTAIIISARSGSAIAAELATMVVQEEVDALKSMGFNPVKFLVTPKIIAMVICMPALTIIAMFAGIEAGFLLGVFTFGISPANWINETVGALSSNNIFVGLSKAFCYAIVIVIVGCHNGLRVTGGARGVGLATTRSVVMDIFFIIIVAAFFALVVG